MSIFILLGVLLAVVAWLTAGAMAVRSVSRIWLRHWVERRLQGSAAASAYLERPQRLLVAASTGIALSVFLGGAMLAAMGGGTDEVAERLLAGALVVLIFGQTLPRVVSHRFASSLVPLLLPALRVFDMVVTPVLAVAAFLARPMHRARSNRTGSTREGIQDLLREGVLEGVGERAEIAIITGVVEFGEKTLAEVMTPRAELFALDVSMPTADLARAIAQSAYSRVPVYRGDPDHILGMVHVFDVLKAGLDSRPALRRVAFAPGTKHCNVLLFEMLRGRLHLAVVQDESGRTLGIVTLEDLLEELVGDIRDEHDEPQPPRAAGAA